MSQKGKDVDFDALLNFDTTTRRKKGSRKESSSTAMVGLPPRSGVVGKKRKSVDAAVVKASERKKPKGSDDDDDFIIVSEKKIAAEFSQKIAAVFSENPRFQSVWEDRSSSSSSSSSSNCFIREGKVDDEAIEGGMLSILRYCIKLESSNQDLSSDKQKLETRVRELEVTNKKLGQDLLQAQAASASDMTLFKAKMQKDLDLVSKSLNDLSVQLLPA